MRRKRFVYLVVFHGLLIVSIMFSGCATIGKDFNYDQVGQIKIGTTTRDDIRELFGSPWRVGVDDGYPTWTYAKYKYSIFGEPQTRDLVIRFNEQGIVNSYVYNTTDHNE